jgi:hypothetical protein
MYLQKVISVEVTYEKRGSGTRSGSISQKYGSEDQDPYQNVTDPEH